MKKIKNSSGWDEIVTQSIKISTIWLDFSTNEDWNNFNRKYPKIGRNRLSCKCCGSKWVVNNSDVDLAITNKGNKCICKLCSNYFQKEGIITKTEIKFD